VGGSSARPSPMVGTAGQRQREGNPKGSSYSVPCTHSYDISPDDLCYDRINDGAASTANAARQDNGGASAKDGPFRN
jgi:hypothetical protein